jgi:glutathione S-transferase
MIRIFGDSRSGNCLKVLWTARHLGIAHEWQEVRALTGQTAEPWFRAMNPAGQVPVVTLADGTVLVESNAIIWHLAEGSPLIPADPAARARMHGWLFWEQYSHERFIAVRRARVELLGEDPASLDPALLVRGNAALTLMEETLQAQPWFGGASFSVADIALLPYTRFAPGGGFDLGPLAAVRDWIGRCEADLGLEPLAHRGGPDHPALRTNTLPAEYPAPNEQMRPMSPAAMSSLCLWKAMIEPADEVLA